MPKTMTSRERVLAAIHHQTPDRVPLNYASNPAIHRAVTKHYGVNESDWDGLFRALGVDFRGHWVPYTGPKLHADIPGRNISVWGMRTRWVEHESGGYWDFCDWPLQNATLEEVEAWPMPSPDHYDYSGVRAFCEKNKDYCRTIGDPGAGDNINSIGMLRTMEQVLIDLATDEPAGLRLMDRKAEVQLGLFARMLDAAKGGYDVFWIGEDLGSQRGALISLEMFRKHIRPRLQKFVDLAKAHNLPVMIHSCGSSSWAFNDFIEMGINVVDTLQPEAANMAPAYLKKNWGEKLAFHGMISTAGPLAYGTVDDVVRNVRETLEIMMPDGGYCLGPTHSIQDNSPVENVIAMYDAAKKYGTY